MAVAKTGGPAPSSEQVTVIIDEKDKYRPLGIKIRRLDYEIPGRFKDIEGVIEYLKDVRAKVAGGENFIEIASGFWKDLGLSSANMESFRKERVLWGEFQKTYEVITEKLLKSNGNGHGLPLDFRATGFERAADFLRPLAYLSITGDSDYVWGYLTPGTVPAEQPPRCRWKYDEMDAERVLYDLQRDLIESFERRNNTYPSVEAKDQCAAPEYPVRIRSSFEINGPDSVDEGGEARFSSEAETYLEYGKGYGSTRELRAESEWTITEYSCEEPPSITASGGEAVFRAPSVLRDCKAKVRSVLNPQMGPARSETREIEILNTVNEGPTVKIERGNDLNNGVVVLTARAEDPNGDPLEYRWEQVGAGPIAQVVDGDSGRTLMFRRPMDIGKDITLIFKVTATDIPQGKRPGEAKSATATYKVLFKTAKEKIQPLDKKRKGVADISQATGGTPEFVVPKDLSDKIIDAITPNSVVESIDAMILLDASGSMRDNIERIREDAAKIIEQARLKVVGGDISRVRIGFASYVDDHYTVHLPLSPIDKGRFRGALQAVIDEINKTGGSRETVWDAIYLGLKGQGWKAGEGSTRRLVYITDEGGDGGALKKTEDDIKAEAKARDVQVEAVFIEQGEDPYWPARSNLEISFEHAMSIRSDRERIDFIKKDYLKRYRELSDLYHWREDGHTPYNMHPEMIRTHFSRLLGAIKDPNLRQKTAEDIFVPLLDNVAVPTWTRISAYEIFGDTICGISDPEKRLRLGRKHLLGLSDLRKPFEKKGLDFDSFKKKELDFDSVFMRIKRELTYKLGMSIKDEAERIDFIKSEIIPMLLEYTGDELLDNIANLFGTIRDPAKRLELAGKTILPLRTRQNPRFAGDDASWYVDTAYGLVVLTHPNINTRLRLAHECVERFTSPEAKKFYISRIALSMPTDEMIVKVLEDDFLPLFGAASEDNPFKETQNADDARMMAEPLARLKDRNVAKRYADKYILPIARGRDIIAFKAYEAYEKATGSRPPEK